MSDPVLDAINAVRQDVAALRRESSHDRQQIAANQVQIAVCSAQVGSAVALLEQHRADDRRELDGLHGALDRERRRVNGLSRWRWTLAGVGLAAFALAGAAGWSDVAQIIAGG
jgi:hypothetical protein